MARRSGSRLSPCRRLEPLLLDESRHAEGPFPSQQLGVLSRSAQETKLSIDSSLSGGIVLATSQGVAN